MNTLRILFFTKPKNYFCLVLLLISSCTVDYEIGESSIIEQERIILNGYLSPVEPVRIHLYQLQKINNKYIVTGLTGYHIALKENKEILFDGFYPDSVFVLEYLPKTGCEYSVEVSYTGLTTVKAQTSIPEAIRCVSDFSTGDYWWNLWEYIVNLKSFEIPGDEKVCIWITCYGLYENGKNRQYNNLYTNNALVDKSNSSAGSEIANETVGSIYHEGFLRVKNSNLSHLNELSFTPMLVYTIISDDEEENEYLTDPYPPQMNIKIISASPEYDRYNKSLFEQKRIISNNSDNLSAIFYQPITVFSNIENGLGIFAGLNEVNYIVDLPEQPDRD